MLELVGITKRFSGIMANDGIDFEVRSGEIHALLGENGAGKTTLMKVAAGLIRPDSGEIRVKNRPVVFHRASDAIRCGIGMVHQHFALVSGMTVAENMILGHEPVRFGWFLDRKKAAEDIRKLSIRYGLGVDPDALAGDLPVGTRQRVEILKILYRDADILVLDEPTAVLTPGETDDFFKTLRSLAETGKSIVFITHKLGEALQVAHRITVLRNGRVVCVLKSGETSETGIAAIMMGRELPLSSEKPPCEKGETILKVQGLKVLDDRHAIAGDGISFYLRQGEILGIAGVQGNGQTELVEALTGLRKPADGKVFLLNEDVTGFDPVRLYRRGLRHIPEDRRKHGMVDRFSIADNLVLNMAGETPFSKLGVLNGTAIRHHAQQQIERFDIRTSDILAPAQTLSGGNQQKLVVAREFSRPVRLLVASQPTRGIDVSATRDIHRLILEKRCEGCAVLVVSTDLDELFELSDRLAVMYRGKLTEPDDTAATDRHRVGLRMAGIGR